MSSKVKQANFRLPLPYMDLIDEIARTESITKAAVITRALDCLKASIDSGGAPAGGSGPGVSEAELNDLKQRAALAESKVAELTGSLESATQARDAADARSREALAARDVAEARANALAKAANEEAGDELRRLRDELAQQRNASSAKDLEIAEKNAALAERESKIATLSEQLGAANAKAELALKNISVEAVPIADASVAEDDPLRALTMLNMIGGVMNAFQQQVDDARAIGEQEGRLAVQHEFQDMVEKARNDGYRDAMGYLDDRVTTARDSGAREERARIANMGFFERRRYLRMHIA